MLKGGAPPLFVAEQTGHDIITMSKHYAAWLEDDDQDQSIVEKILG